MRLVRRRGTGAASTAYRRTSAPSASKVAADYKQKGDWCKEHNRPESQCFLCNPKLEAKFAAEYEAKYGKKPPKPEGK